MADFFLNSLVDSSGSIYLFGKKENAPQSIFIVLAHDPVKVENNNSSDFISLYKENQLKPVHSGPVSRNNVSPDWFFPVILIVLVIYTWLRVYYGRFFSMMLQAFVNKNISNQIVRDENIFVQRVTVFLSILFNLNIALFLYLTSIHYNWHMGGIDTGFSRFLFFVLIISVTYALKFLILKICGWLFEQEREVATYIFNIFLINNILGMVLFPIVLLIAYNESIAFSWLTGISVGLIIIAFAWRLFRGLQIGLSIGSFSPLYLFLYLCTLEIAPLMVLIRIIVQ